MRGALRLYRHSATRPIIGNKKGCCYGIRYIASFNSLNQQSKLHNIPTDADTLQEMQTFDSVFKRMEDRRMDKLVNKQDPSLLNVIFENRNKNLDDFPEDRSEDKIIAAIRESLFGSQASQLNSKENLPVSKIHMNSFPLKLNLQIPNENLEKIKYNVNYKARMDTAMKPYMDKLLSTLENDYQLLNYFQDLLATYKSSGEQEKTDLNTMFSKISNSLKKQPININTIPTPYQKTIPYIIIELFNRPGIKLSTDSKFRIVSFIYHQCKDYSDVRLYLNICNVEFYNLLLRLTWETYSNINQIEELVEEMRLNGVSGDIETTKFLDNVVDCIKGSGRDITEGSFSEPSTLSLIPSLLWTRDNVNRIGRLMTHISKLKSDIV